MKTTTSLLFAGAVALGFTVTTASAADTAASPRFRQTLNEREAVTSTASSPNLVSNTYLGSTAKWGLNVPKVAPSGSVTPNLVSGNYAGAASKHPYPPPTRFEIAPLIEKGKAGKTCEMDCCVKK
jgi:hypothetical protein